MVTSMLGTVMLVAALLADAHADGGVAPPAVGKPPHVVARTYSAMGTEVAFSIFTADEAKADRAFAAAYDEIRRVERLMTDWQRVGEPKSDVVLINEAAGKKPVKVSAETVEVIVKSLEMSKRSEGAFDITYAAMRGLWKFDEEMDKTLPAAAEIARRRKLIDWRAVVVDAKAGTVKLRRPGMRIGLGGIAKGYAVDRVVALLRRAHVAAALVSAGGSTIFGMGAPPGREAWDVDIQDPGGAGRVALTVPLRNRALSVSGRAEKSFEREGIVYAHIMDPRTARPVQGVLSVAVLTSTGTAGDALDDAFFVEGVEGTRAHLSRVPATEAIFFLPDREGWRMVRLEGPPR
jgi:FAD:protein FMN transferase